MDWKDAAKELAKALAKAGASAVLRGVILCALSLVLNLTFSVLFFFLSKLVGGGHGSLILFPLALLPFAPFVVLAVVVAQKQGVMRLVAAAVESQSPTIAKLSEHYLGSFLREKYGDLKQTKVGGTFDKGWGKYLRSRSEGSWAVRTVIAQVTGRVPLGEIIDEVAEQQTSSDQVPREVMVRVMRQVSEDRLSPSWAPVLVLFGANLLWFPLVTWGVDRWLSQ